MGKICWRKAQLPASVFLPREFHGQRSLAATVQGVIQPMGWQRVGHDWVTNTFTFKCLLFRKGFPCGSAGKESACNVGDLGLIPGLGRSPGEGKSYPLQYSGLEKPMDYTVHGVAKRHDWEIFTSLSLFCICMQIHDLIWVSQDSWKVIIPEKNTRTQRLSDLSIWSHSLPKTR